MMNLITEYFKNLTPVQVEQFRKMDGLYREWNSRINVISRKDMDSLYLHHVLHSLAVAKVISFPAGSTVLDVGTGGGFPGIPLAVLFPESQFTLCDSIGKKVKVAENVAAGLGLKNVKCIHARCEEIDGKFDFAVSRAVTDLSSLYQWVRNRFSNALICLKGGDLEEEIHKCCVKHSIKRERFYIADISEWFTEDFFLEKKIVIISQ